MIKVNATIADSYDTWQEDFNVTSMENKYEETK